MAIYTQFDEDGATLQVASNMGWSDFGEYIEKQKDAPLAKALWETGLCEKIPALRKELLALLETNPEKDIASVIDQLVHNIDGTSAKILLITNGVAKG